MSTVGFHTPDHTHCVADAIASAEAYCASKNIQFTPVRKRSLEILLEAHRAIGAYDLLKRLSDEGFGSQPPVAYRALDFLTKHDFVHKIEKLNAFIACSHPTSGHTPAFLICTSCETVAEAAANTSKILWSQIEEQSSFQIEKAVIEAEGICPACQESNAE